MLSLLSFVISAGLLAGVVLLLYFAIRKLINPSMPAPGPDHSASMLTPMARVFDSLTVRALLIGLLALLMLIPLLFIEDIVRERAARCSRISPAPGADSRRSWGRYWLSRSPRQVW